MRRKCHRWRCELHNARCRFSKADYVCRALFRIEGVRRVFLAEDYVTITKDSEDTDWSVVKPHIFATIMDCFAMKRPIVNWDAYER